MVIEIVIFLCYNEIKIVMKGHIFMDERYYIEIQVLDKVEEILDIFKEYSPKVYSKTDSGYDWLEEDDSKCIVFENPNYDQQIEIDVGDMGEFLLFFAKSHAHYANYQLDYDQLIECIRNILNNNVCAGVITDINDKWYGSAFFGKEEIIKKPQEVFEFVFKEKEFYEKLTRHGYKIEYAFWNPKDNKTFNQIGKT